MALTDDQLMRYSRHITLKEIGVRGQKKLLAAKVLIIGAGGLGAPAAMYLAAAGVGTIGIADHDEVELSNLQRQIIHTTADLGKPKAESAAETIRALNPDVSVKTYHQSVYMEQRQYQHCRVLTGQSVTVRYISGFSEKIALSEHNPLRLAGSSRSKDHLRNVFWFRYRISKRFIR